MGNYSFSMNEVEGTIAQRFASQVTLYGDRPAYTDGKVTLSYWELDQRSNAIANALLTLPIDVNAPPVVALLCSQGEAAIASIIGILKAGLAYLPLDTGSPTLRLRGISEDAKTQAIVTDKRHIGTARQIFDRHTMIVTYEESQASALKSHPDVHVGTLDQACVLYTSGSTGFPKAVPEIHRNVLHNIRSYILAANLHPEDKLSLFHTHSFGASRLDIFGALLSGACLHHFDLNRSDFARLTDQVIASSLSVYHSTPTLFRNLLSASKSGSQFSKVRLVHLGSEPVLRTDFELFKKHFSTDSRFLNRYGTTETGTISFFQCSSKTTVPGTRVPAGHVVDGLSVQIEDANGDFASAGESGEVLVRSRYLSHGSVVGHEGENAERIYRTGDLGHLRPDGCLVVSGRKEGMTKLHGKRVDLKEIEVAISRLDEVDSSVVRIVEDETGDAKMVAYLVRGKEADLPDGSIIRDRLSKILPMPLIPTVFVEIPSLPVTANSKLNYQQLPKPSVSSNNESRSTHTEIQVLCDIFCSILGTEVGPDDDFFMLGGNSLKALSMLGEVTRACGRETTLQDVFEHPTPRGLFGRS